MTDTSDAASDVERAVTGLTTRHDIDSWLAEATISLLGAELSTVLFRSGRIDAVYGTALADGRRVLVKLHRRPVDLTDRTLIAQVQTLLADADFPCALPLAGPVEHRGQVVSVETLLPDGGRRDGHDPAVRRATAAGLARHVEIMTGRGDLVAKVGTPPAWCDYRLGAWGRSHDPFFDFRTTPAGYGWLQEFAQDAADLLNAARGHFPVVAAHGDWYCGNLGFDDADRLVAVFDWDLVADSEAAVAGIAAGGFTNGARPLTGPPTPDETRAFIADYERARGRVFTAEERAVTQAAARWNIAYSARCDLANRPGTDPEPGSALHLLATRRTEYLAPLDI